MQKIVKLFGKKNYSDIASKYCTYNNIGRRRMFTWYILSQDACTYVSSLHAMTCCSLRQQPWRNTSSRLIDTPDSLLNTGSSKSDGLQGPDSLKFCSISSQDPYFCSPNVLQESNSLKYYIPSDSIMVPNTLNTFNAHVGCSSLTDC